MTDRLLTEDETIELLIEHMKNVGWEITDFCLGHQRGYDIVAVKDGTKLFVEAKGAKANDKSPIRKRDKFDSGQLKTHLGKAIVKCFDTKIENPDAFIAIAHPNSQYLNNIISKYIPQLNHAGIIHYFVEETEIIEDK